ncbi:MAG TPA: c-type cytochrome [Gemmatimonadales bacterium]
MAGALLLLFGVACGGERRSGAASTDSSATADTAAVAAKDTAKTTPDTSTPTPAPAATPAPPETTRALGDTNKKTAAKPPTRRTTPRPSPKPAPKPASSDTATATTATSDSSSAAEQTTAAAPLRDPYHTAPLDTVPQQVYDGWKQFNLNCARCHGEDVQGTTIAPHLIVSLRPDGPINTKELFIQTVCAGRPGKGMPSWCALGMEMSTIESIYSYVKGRSDAKIHPGRPAVKSGG